MNTLHAAPARPPISSRFWHAGLAALVLVICLVRGALLFGTPLMPGMNGAYYLVQARSVLAHGTLGIPDLPLTFFLQAALARVIGFFWGGGADASIVLAVKLADAVLPALAALPVYFLVRHWARGAAAPVWLAPAAAAVATLNGSMLHMVGDFEKNSLGLVWLTALLLALQVWMTRPSLGRAAVVLGFWGLAAVTHIGVFGASVLFGGLALGFFAVAQGRAGWQALTPLLGAVLAIVLLAAAVVLWKFDPQRIHRLAQALVHPADYLSGSALPGGGGPGGFPGPMRGGPGGGFRTMQSAPFLGFGLVALAALTVCWQRRRTLAPGEGAVAAACAVGVLVLTGPWVQGDKTDRFYLLAMMPAVLAGAFALVHWPRPRLRAAVAGLALLGVLASSCALLRRGGQPIVTEAGVRELRALAPLIEHPETTLVSARHGMEWWTAWTLGTHIAQSTALRTADWETYSAVFFLHSNDSEQGRPPGGGGPGGLGGPPPFFPGAPGGSGPGQRPGGGGGPMSDPQIPSDAQTVHEGAHFRLARVLCAPVFVTEQTEQAAAKK